jgi:hypothetical protein
MRAAQRRGRLLLSALSLGPTAAIHPTANLQLHQERRRRHLPRPA